VKMCGTLNKVKLSCNLCTICVTLELAIFSLKASYLTNILLNAVLIVVSACHF